MGRAPPDCTPYRFERLPARACRGSGDYYGTRLRWLPCPLAIGRPVASSEAAISATVSFPPSALEVADSGARPAVSVCSDALPAAGGSTHALAATTAAPADTLDSAKNSNRKFGTLPRGAAPVSP